jgi:hypothetical protein
VARSQSPALERRPGIFDESPRPQSPALKRSPGYYDESPRLPGLDLVIDESRVMPGDEAYEELLAAQNALPGMEKRGSLSQSPRRLE